MLYVHYWHFAKQWYAYISESSKSERIPSGNESDYFAYECKKCYLVDGSAGLSNRQIKVLLNKLYPHCILIKEIAFHEGARWFGNKEGSRR